MQQANANEASIESQIQAKGLNAPRVKPEDLTANIAHVEYVTHVTKGGQVLRWAILTTQNGFAVTGKPSVAVSPENDNADIGRQVAYDNARDELWPLMGYALKERLHLEVTAPQPQTDNAHVAPGCEQFAETISFDDLVQYGRDNGANIVNGMPWSFEYKGRAVSHENDERYLISVPNSAVSLNFTPGDLLVAHADGSLSVTPGVARA